MRLPLFRQPNHYTITPMWYRDANAIELTVSLPFMPTSPFGYFELSPLKLIILPRYSRLRDDIDAQSDLITNIRECIRKQHHSMPPTWPPPATQLTPNAAIATAGDMI